jgi:hypothetical protein
VCGLICHHYADVVTNGTTNLNVFVGWLTALISHQSVLFLREKNDNDNNASKYDMGRGCTGEFFCAKVKKVLVPRTQEKRSQKTSRRTIRATPQIGDFHFRQWWPLSTCGLYFALLR